MEQFHLNNINSCYRISTNLDPAVIRHHFDHVVEHELPHALDVKLAKILAQCGFSDRYHIVIRNIDYRMRVHGHESGDLAIAEGWADGIATAIFEKLQNIQLNTYNEEVALFESCQAAELSVISNILKKSTIPWFADSLAENDQELSIYTIIHRWINTIPEQFSQLLKHVLVENSEISLNLLNKSEAESIFRLINHQSASRLKAITQKDFQNSVDESVLQGTVRCLNTYYIKRIVTDFPWLNAEAIQNHKNITSLFIYTLIKEVEPGFNATYESFVGLLETILHVDIPAIYENELLNNIDKGQKIGKIPSDPIAEDNMYSAEKPEPPDSTGDAEKVNLETEKQAIDVGCGGLLYLINAIIKVHEPDNLLAADINRKLSDLGVEILRQLLSGLPEDIAQNIYEREKILIKVFSGQDIIPDKLSDFTATSEVAELFVLLTNSLPDDVINNSNNIAFIYGEHALPFSKQSTMANLAYVVFRPGKLLITPTHADLYLPSNTIDLALRRAGLDINPCWVPFLGRVIQFHYQ